MKTVLAFLVILAVAFVNAGPFMEEEADPELQMALQEHRDAVNMDEAKRTLPTNIKDSLHTPCCKYMKAKGICAHKPVYNICHYTCGCWNILSEESCKTLRGYGRCKVPVFRDYCAKRCSYCPHLKG